MKSVHMVDRWCIAAIAVLGLCMSAFATPVWVFDEPFTNDVPSAGWLIQGFTNGASAGDEGGVPLTGGQMLGTPGVPNGFIRFTTPDGGYQRASAVYTTDWVWSQNWTMEAEFNCEAGADGVAFSCIGIDNGVLTSNTTYKALGGSGGFMGVPRANTAFSTNGCGSYSGISGYSLQFDTYQNYFGGGKEAADTNYALVRCRNLLSWTDVPGSTSNFFGNPDFFASKGWVKFRLVQAASGANGVFTFYWGTNYENSYTFTKNEIGPAYPALFGTSAGCGGFMATHDVRNFRVFGEIVPEPGTALVVLALAALIRRRN